MTFDPYKILGIEVTAILEEIHAAYRKLCKTLHPDAGGGADAFIDLSRAYEILSKPELRKKYDEVGIADNYVDEAVDNLQQLFINMIGTIPAENLHRVDVVGMMVQNIVMQRANFANMLNTLKQQKNQNENNLSIIKKRLKSKKKNFLIYAAEESIAKILIPIAQNEKQISLCDQMLEMLSNYEYEWEETPEQSATISQWSIYNPPFPNVYK